MPDKIPVLLTLTHANTGQKISLARVLVAGWYYSAQQKCTFVIASGGAIFPARETVDEVCSIYERSFNPSDSEKVGQ